MHRFFIPPHSIQGQKVILPETIAHQLRNVLRMRLGSHIVVLDNQGWEYEIELTEIERKSAIGQVLEKRLAPGEPSIQLTLYQSILKKHNFELVLQKGTEIGVTRFVPMITERTIVSDVKDSKLDRWERIITEAAEQSRRGKLPELHEPIEFEQVLAEVAQFDLALIPYEEEKTQRISDMLPQKCNSVAILIGAEGGFSEAEIEQAKSAGIYPVTLGKRILRAETAAIVACAIVLHTL